MAENVFQVFMGRHAPVGDLVQHAEQVLWVDNALDPVIKERMRIALAEAIGCSYCTRFRTAEEGEAIMERDAQLSEADQARAALVERYAAAAVAPGGPSDELTVELQGQFSEAEFSDLIFSLGWFVGMQHVGRLMHWDNACPVAPIRALVEAGKAA
ncbi:hypothetical protein [Conexibacter sp. CPCC 206217]|uniref:hypothetical protein n=1 Tax=Conexibacter sp. CPCC 206217 TaxID=3064574 RepID=UPI002724790E|nr:hypothetical protein [Conexibacter sp. CPCC 206217]MDO8209566.1 hypothetical protein [Conexibacter sp. CPCC 206217]